MCWTSQIWIWGQMCASTSGCLCHAKMEASTRSWNCAFFPVIHNIMFLHLAGSWWYFLTLHRPQETVNRLKAFMERILCVLMSAPTDGECVGLKTQFLWHYMKGFSTPTARLHVWLKPCGADLDSLVMFSHSLLVYLNRKCKNIQWVMKLLVEYVRRRAAPGQRGSLVVVSSSH